MHSHSKDALFGLVDYVYDHFDSFRFVLCHAAGSPYEHWLEPVIATEEESTRIFIETIRRSGFPVAEIGDQLIHILCSVLFHGVMETAIRHITLLREFSGAGWARLLGLSKS